MVVSRSADITIKRASGLKLNEPQRNMVFAQVRVFGCLETAIGNLGNSDLTSRSLDK